MAKPTPSMPVLTGASQLVPILADPVDHVIAPRFYNPAFAAAGLDWFMVPIGVRSGDFAATLAQLARVTNLRGVNVTMPHKVAARVACARVTDEARRVGIVNTLRLAGDGAWEGESSDGPGFIGAAQAAGVLDVTRPVVIVGTGSAGRAIAFALAAEGVRELRLRDVDEARAARLAAEIETTFGAVSCRMAAAAHHGARPQAVDPDALSGAGLVVNATPLGLEASDPHPFDVDRIDYGCAVFDIVAARESDLVGECRARGLAVVEGTAMIEHQLAVQIAFWQGDTALARHSE